MLLGALTDSLRKLKESLDFPHLNADNIDYLFPQEPWLIQVDGGFFCVLRRPNFQMRGDSLAYDGCSILQRLEHNGVILVGPYVAGRNNFQVGGAFQTLKLSGGSVCSTYLDCASMTVQKEVRHSELDAVDSFVRHYGEFEFMGNPSISARSLFPKSRRVEIPGDQFSSRLETEFIWGYTLGERVVRGEISGATLCTIVQDLIAQLEQSLWRSGPERLQRSYFEVVSRRFWRLLTNPIFAELWNNGAIINGECFPGIAHLLSAAQQRWPVLASLSGHGAHGDLILEDIVISLTDERKWNVKLVDPNPQNVSWFIDFSKLMMSAMLRYELIYCDLYDCCLSADCHPLEVIYEFDEATNADCLKELEDYLIRTVGLTPIGSSLQSSAELLRVQACLNMLALPVFHYIEHNQLQRSVMFSVVPMRELYFLLMA